MITKSLKGKYKNTLHFIDSLIHVAINGYPAKNLTVIGVTGTDGKTTVSHLIYEMLKNSGKQVALISTVAAYIGDKVVNTGFHVTTPDAKFLQPLIKRMKEKEVKYLVLEATSHGLDQHRTLGCNFWGGVLTNITHEHLDYHTSLERYKNAKSKLFKKVKVAVLNRDDLSYKYFKSVIKSGSNVISYALEGSATYKATNISLKKGVMTFWIIEGGKKFKLHTSLIGDYNVSNILAAVGIARALNIKWDIIRKTVTSFSGVSGRMEIIKGNQPFTVIVDFAHTPNALENVLRTLRGLKPKGGRLIVVFGCAGERDVKKRPMMADISTRLADVSIFTAEDPRHEDVNEIIEKMVKGVKKSSAVEVDKLSKINQYKNKNVFLREPNRKKAISFAIEKIARKGDTVVICGKGHEKSMSYEGVEYPWSDKEAVMVALSDGIKKIDRK